MQRRSAARLALAAVAVLCAASAWWAAPVRAQNNTPFAIWWTSSTRMLRQFRVDPITGQTRLHTTPAAFTLSYSGPRPAPVFVTPVWQNATGHFVAEASQDVTRRLETVNSGVGSTRYLSLPDWTLPATADPVGLARAERSAVPVMTSALVWVCTRPLNASEAEAASAAIWTHRLGGDCAFPLQTSWFDVPQAPLALLPAVWPRDESAGGVLTRSSRWSGFELALRVANLPERPEWAPRASPTEALKVENRALRPGAAAEFGPWVEVAQLRVDTTGDAIPAASGDWRGRVSPWTGHLRATLSDLSGSPASPSPSAAGNDYAQVRVCWRVSLLASDDDPVRSCTALGTTFSLVTTPDPNPTPPPWEPSWPPPSSHSGKSTKWMWITALAIGACVTLGIAAAVVRRRWAASHSAAVAYVSANAHHPQGDVGADHWSRQMPAGDGDAAAAGDAAIPLDDAQQQSAQARAAARSGNIFAAASAVEFGRADAGGDDDGVGLVAAAAAAAADPQGPAGGAPAAAELVVERL